MPLGQNGQRSQPPKKASPQGNTLPSIDPFASVYQTSIVHRFNIDIRLITSIVIDCLQPQVLSSSVEDPMGEAAFEVILADLLLVAGWTS